MDPDPGEIRICILMMDVGEYCQRMTDQFVRVFKKIKGVKVHFIRYDEEHIMKKIRTLKCHAIIISGSNQRIFAADAPELPRGILWMGLPILGLCYGYEWMVHKLGGKVATFTDGNEYEYRKYITIPRPFVIEVPKKQYKFLHHDYISELPKGWEVVCRAAAQDNTQSPTPQIWIGQHKERDFYGMQFHPEVFPSSAIAFYSRWVAWLKEKRT
jgi:GMP synthase (glutamine-hydrolysing)